MSRLRSLFRHAWVVAWLVAAPAVAQSLDEAARFVFEYASVNPDAAPAFNPDHRPLDVALVAPCGIRLSRLIAFADPAAASAPVTLQEVADIDLRRVDLSSGTVTTETTEGGTTAFFRFVGSDGAVRTRTVRVVEQGSGSRRTLVPDGFDDVAVPRLVFLVTEQGERGGRTKAAFEYLIGRYCGSRRLPY